MTQIAFYDVEQAAALSNAPTATAATAAAKSPYAALELLDAGFAAFNADYAATVAAFEQSLAELDSLTELIAAGAPLAEARELVKGAQVRLAETSKLLANVAEREEQVIAVQKSIVKSLGGAETDDFAALQEGFAAALAEKLDLKPNELELATTDAAKTTAAAIVSKALAGTEAAAAISKAASADAAAAEKAVVIKAVAKANEAASKAASKAAKALAKAAAAEKQGDKAAAALAKAQAKAAKELVKTVEQQKKNIAKAEAKAAQEALDAAKKAAEAEKAAVAEAAKKGADELRKEAAAAKTEAQKQLAEQKAAEQKAAAEAKAAEKAAAEAEAKALDEVKAAIAAGKDADAAADAAKPVDAELAAAEKDAASKAETGSSIVNPELDKALDDAMTPGQSGGSTGGSTGSSTGGSTQVDTSFAFNYSATCKVVFKSKADYEKFVAGIEVAEQPGNGQQGAPAGGTVEASKEKKAAEPKTVAETAGETKPAEGAETKPAEPAKPAEPTDAQIKEALGQLAAKDWAAKGIVMVDGLAASAAAANEMKFIQKDTVGTKVPVGTEVFTADDTITIKAIADLDGDKFTVAAMKSAGVKSIGGKAFDQGSPTTTNVKLTFDGGTVVEFAPAKAAEKALTGDQFDALVLLKASSSPAEVVAAGASKIGDMTLTKGADGAITGKLGDLDGLKFGAGATLAKIAALKADTATAGDLAKAGVDTAALADSLGLAANDGFDALAASAIATFAKKTADEKTLSALATLAGDKELAIKGGIDNSGSNLFLNLKKTDDKIEIITPSWKISGLKDTTKLSTLKDFTAAIESSALDKLLDTDATIVALGHPYIDDQATLAQSAKTYTGTAGEYKIGNVVVKGSEYTTLQQIVNWAVRADGKGTDYFDGAVSVNGFNFTNGGIIRLGFGEAVTLQAGKGLGDLGTVTADSVMDATAAAVIASVGKVAISSATAAKVSAAGSQLDATISGLKISDIAALSKAAGKITAGEQGALKVAPADASDTALDLSALAAGDKAWVFDGAAAAVTITAPTVAAGSVINFSLSNFDASDSLKIAATGATQGADVSPDTNIGTDDSEGTFTVTDGAITLKGATLSDALVLKIAGKLDDQAANSVYKLADGSDGVYLINIGAQNNADDNIIVHLSGTVGEITIGTDEITIAGASA